jgi:hypothetical protein
VTIGIEAPHPEPVFVRRERGSDGRSTLRGGWRVAQVASLGGLIRQIAAAATVRANLLRRLRGRAAPLRLLP